MLSDHDIDELSERVLSRLLVDGATVTETARALVAEMAALRPDAPALLCVLPMSMAAAAIEGMLTNGQPRRIAPEAWRIAALLAAETLSLHDRTSDAPAPTIAALWAHLRADPQALGAAGPAAVTVISAP
jgi:hypothetical protein